MSFGQKPVDRTRDRIAKVSAPRASHGRAIGSQGRSPSSTSQDQQTNNFVIGFAAVAVVLIVGGGVVSAVSGEASPKLEQKETMTSRVEETCSEGWEKEQSNVDQMYCYLTSDVERLCRPSERRHLIATIEKFEKDYGAWNRRFNLAAMNSAFAARAASPQLAIATARLNRSQNDPDATPHERAEAQAKMFEMTGKILAEPHKVMAEKPNKVPYYKLEGAITKLASSGYISDGDFNRGKPKWVNQGLKAVTQVDPECRP